MADLTITARIHSDCFNVDITLDVTEYFSDLVSSNKGVDSDEFKAEIIELISDGLSSSYSTDKIADFYSKTSTAKLFEVTHEDNGFAVIVCKNEFKAWLKDVAKDLYSQLYVTLH